ncbi:MAG TPA: hypothetical protein VN038_01250 [Dyadobacter sp.]|nr:hypothetical protein [Dyadobacter sp.]
MAFLRPTPATFDYSKAQTPQSANVLPNFTLPAGHVFSGATGREGWTQPLMLSKGFSHYDRDRAGDENGGNQAGYEATYPKRVYWSVPRINDTFGMNTNTSQDQCKAFAAQMPLNYTLVVLETMENVNTLAPEAIQWKWFHDEWKRLADIATASDGKPRLRCHNYFRFANGIWALGQQDWETHRQLYTTPVNNWPSISYVDSFGLTQTAINLWSPGQNLQSCNLIVEGVYQGNPDADRDSYFGTIFAMETASMQGKMPGIFLFGVREWRPNWPESTVYSDGRFTRNNKVKLHPKALRTWAFLGQEFGGTNGGCSIEYGLNSYQPVSKKPVEYFAGVVDANTDRWKATAASDYSPFPYYGGAGPGRYTAGGGDFFHFGVHLWNSTFGQVNGGTRNYMRFRVSGINSNAWFERATANSDIINARRDRRPIVRCCIQGSKMAVMYLNPYANHTKMTLEFQHPTTSTTWTRTVCGTGIHAELIDL